MAKSKNPGAPKKSTSTATDNWDLDFDFDDGFGDLDAKINSEAKNIESQKPDPKSRKPYTKVLKGAIAGASELATSEEMIRTLSRSALPKEYDVIYDRGVRFGNGLIGLKNDAIREVKPVIKRGTKLLDKLSTEENSIAQKLKRKLNDTFDIYEDYKSPSKTQIEEQSIATSLGEIFGKSLKAQADAAAEQEARNEVKSEIDRQVDSKRFKAQYASLASMDKNIANISQYTLQVTSAWQKKSLELQYRSYFAMTEMNNMFKLHAEASKAQLDAIKLNTGLPEYRKLQLSERAGEMTRNKFLSAGSRLFTNSDVMQKGFENLSKAMNDKLNNMRFAFESGLDIADSMIEMRESAKAMEDFADDGMGGMGDTDSFSSEYMAGRLGAGMILKNPMSKLAYNLGKKLRGLFPKGGGVDRLGKKIIGPLQNPAGFAQEQLNSRWLNDYNSSVPPAVLDMLRTVFESFSAATTDKTLATQGGAGKLTEAAIFDNRVYRSVTDVIPGYLSRILVQNTRLANHFNAPQVEALVYDYDRYRFTTSKEIKTNIQKTMTAISGNGYVNRSLDTFTQKTTLNKYLKPEELESLKSAITEWVVAGNQVNLGLLQSEEFLRLVPTQHRSAVRSAMDEMGFQKDDIVDDEGEDRTVANLFDRYSGNISESIPDLRRYLQTQLNAGNHSILQEMGLIKGDTPYGFNARLNDKAYAEAVRRQEDPNAATPSPAAKEKRRRGRRFATSDIHAKMNIRGVKGNSALDGLTQIDNKTWSYKEKYGTGDYFGPMAQDVYSQFGSEAAPGGTKIDMVTMNGINMQAIKDLNKKVDDKIANEQSGDKMLEVLQAIQGFTDISADKLTQIEMKLFGGLKMDFEKLGIFGRIAMGQFNPEAMKKMGMQFKDSLADHANAAWDHVSDGLGNAYDAFNMGPMSRKQRMSDRMIRFAKTPSKNLSGKLGRLSIGALGLAFKMSEKTLDGLRAGAEFGKNSVWKPGVEWMSGKYSKHKDDAKKVIGKFMKSAFDLATSVYDKTKNLITNQIPKGLRDVWGNLRKASNAVAAFIDQPVDIYVRGEAMPRLTAQLMRMGGYFDLVTKKPITRPGEITGPVCDAENRVLINADDLQKGLVDINGNEIEGLKWKIMRWAKDRVKLGISRVNNVLGFAKKKLSQTGEMVSDAAKNIGIGTGGYGKMIYNVLLDIRDISMYQGRLGGKKKLHLRSAVDEKRMGDVKTSEVKTDTKPPGPGSTGGDGDGTSGSGKLDLGNLKQSMTDKAKGKWNQLREAAPMYKGKNVFDILTDKVKDKYSQYKEKREEKKAFNDKDGDGQRDGGLFARMKERAIEQKERLKDLAERRKLKAVEGKYRGQNIFDAIGEKLSAVKGMFSSAIDSVSDIAGSIMDGFGGKGKPGAPKVPGRPGVPGKVGMMGRALNAAKTVGQGAWGLAKGAANLAFNPFSTGSKILKGGMMAVRGAQAAAGAVSLLGKSGIALMGLSGSGTAAAAGTAVSGLLASPLVPFLAGAAVLGVAAYGAYKAYKYLTRNNASKIDMIRLASYGLTDADKSNFHRIFGLEQMIAENAQDITNGRVTINESKIDGEGVLSILGIDPKTETGAAKMEAFRTWFYKRFIPVYVQNREALYEANNKLKMEDISKLSGEELKKYVKRCEVPFGIYNYQDSPFMEQQYLTATPDTFKAAVDAVYKETEEKKPPVVKPPVLPKPPEQAKDLKDVQNAAKDAGKVEEDTKKKTEDEIKKKKEEVDKIKPMGNGTFGGLISGIASGLTFGMIGERTPPDAEKPVSTPSADTAKMAPPTGSATSVTAAGGPMVDGAAADQYLKFQNKDGLNGVNPQFVKQFRAMVQEYGEKTGKQVIVTSGYRSMEDQARLYRADPRKAAKPGRSLHEFGLALDVDSKALNEMDKLGLMKKYGFTRPVGGEPWHMEAAGYQGQLDKAKQDPSWAAQAIEGSIGRGGGGLGTMPNAQRYTRDNKLAQQLFNTEGRPVDEKEIQAAQEKMSSMSAAPQTGAAASGPTPGPSSSAGSGGGVSLGGAGGAATVGNIGTGIAQQAANNEKMSTVDGEASPSKAAAASKIQVGTDRQAHLAMIDEVAKLAGVDPYTLKAFGAIESGFRANAQAGTSSAGGMFQFIDSTWKAMLKKHGNKYGLDPNTPKNDPRANALMAAEYMKENGKYLSKFKSNLTPGDYYAAHMLGAGGAGVLLQADDNAIAANILPRAAGSNKGIFYHKDGTPRTVGELKQLYTNKIDNAGKNFGFSKDQTSTTAPETTSTGTPGSNDFVGPEQTKPAATPGVPGVGVNKPVAAPPSAETPAPKPVQNPREYVAPTLNRKPPIDQGQGLNLTPVTEGLSSIDQTLKQSLGVQQQMLSALLQVASNLSPEQLAALIKGGQQQQPQANVEKDTLKNIPVPMSRKIA